MFPPLLQNQYFESKDYQILKTLREARFNWLMWNFEKNSRHTKFEHILVLAREW